MSPRIYVISKEEWHLDIPYRHQHLSKSTTRTQERNFRLAWENYALATELNKKAQPVQVATLMTVIGEDAREVCSTFTDWAQEGDDQKIAPVLKKLGEYCEPRKNIPFERYRFNRRVQDPGETYNQYPKAL